MHLYQALVDDLSTQIQAGVFRPGERLPSIRSLQRQRGLSRNTVMHAFDRLEALGVIERRQRSGYFVSRHLPTRTHPSAPSPASSVSVDVSDLVFATLQATRNRETVPLGSAFPDPQLFPLRNLGMSMARSARALDPWTTVEDLPPGSLELRRQIARRYINVGVRVGVDDIVITSGAMEALNLALQAVASPGDTIAVESPAFYAALQAVERLGMKAVEIPCDPETGVNLDALRQALASHPVRACWFMTNYQNPTGSLMPEDSRRELVSLLAEYGIPLIEDDVYAELYHDQEPPPPAKHYDTSGLVIHCGSFAKWLAPGYRVGWVAAGRYTQALARLKTMTTMATCVPAQDAIADYLGRARYTRHLRRLRRELIRQRNALEQALAKYFPTGTRWTRPLGGYFLWVQLPSGTDALTVHRQAAEAGISVAPGPLFSASGRFGNCLRLNFGHRWDDTVDQALATLGRITRNSSFD
ncbi:PLP-dependent aminotransferase family protein [Arhodomonas sp. AD133]|uniref:aminotransferase-like domain-containing protein n=1 Tax=Arhodomonas sp. AD133 TaxID=3415009 RepID=UPI003EBE6579